MRLCIPLAVALTAAACQDYKVTPRSDVEGGAGADTASACLIDSGLARDTAAADCVVARDGSVQVGPEWSRSEFFVSPEYNQVLAMPTFGDLDGDGIPEVVITTDDDDQASNIGLLRIIGGRDGEELATVDNWQEVLDSGDTVVFTTYRYSGTALGDVDADGSPEIVMVVLVDINPVDDPGGGGEDTDTGPGGGDSGGEDSGDISPVSADLPGSAVNCGIAVLDAQGSPEWALVDPLFTCGGHAPVIADLDADGRPEIVLGSMIFDGATGQLRGWGSGGGGAFPAYPEIGYLPVAADLDLDGIQEVVAGSSVYDPDGETLCAVDPKVAELPALESADGFPGVADLDGDGLGEFVVIGGGQARIYEDDCRFVTGWELGVGGNGGPPTIGDYDADGLPEIGVSGADSYRVFDPDGTLLWSMDEVVDQSSQSSVASLFDLDGDGRMEVIFSDEVALWVLDGPTGDILVRDDRHTSRTLHEYPVVGDVDADGEVEILVPNGGGHYGIEMTGIYLLESALDPWLPGRPVWNQHAYSITNVDDDLSIPRTPAPNWPAHNNFRSGDPGSPEDRRAPDLWPQAGDVCVDCVSDAITISYRLFNSGSLSIDPDVAIAIYWVDDFDGTWNLIERFELGEPLAPGSSTAAYVLELTTEEVPDGELVIAADDPGEGGGEGVVAECSEDNNILILTDLSCED